MPSSGIQIPELPRKKWSREEVCVLESTGLLDGQHLELIEGELTPGGQSLPQGDRDLGPRYPSEKIPARQPL